ncbi:hypothetical protein [Actinomyces sp. ZJ308]|uniref:hypothetical protein n=1 Tax=Actinomyces sp. ZJ308 TaxID=2708342 RepID=UPI0014201B66|nr:hypothetical protein [Actinomyces sp. ZJ308]
MTRSLTARTRVLAAGAALLIAVGALTGCNDRPGQAADMRYTGMDGTSHSIVVTEKDIDVVAKDMEPKPGQASQGTDQQRQTPTRVDIAGALIEAPIITEVGHAHGITITDAQIVQLAKEQLGVEPREASTLAYLRANILFNQFRQQQDQAQAIAADLSRLRGTLTGDRSPRYPDSAPAWWTQEDPRLSATNNPSGGNQQQPQQQQVPQQGGQQQVPQQGGQQPQQQAPQQGGGEQPSDSGQTDGQAGGETESGTGEGAADGAADGAEQPGQANGGLDEGGTGQSEGDAR